MRAAGPGYWQGQRKMDIDWMTRDELAEAIPPAYTEFIGEQLLAAIQYLGPVTLVQPGL